MDLKELRDVLERWIIQLSTLWEMLDYFEGDVSVMYLPELYDLRTLLRVFDGNDVHVQAILGRLEVIIKERENEASVS